MTGKTHGTKRHSGWTAYPGQPDLEKYKREQREKGAYFWLGVRYKTTED